MISEKSDLSSLTSEENLEKPLDVFISYRRSNGSQLASLLKVHLALRGFSVFIDVERLEAGKFDNNLLQSITQAKHFVLVLTPDALDRCIGDHECKDWIHRVSFPLVHFSAINQLEIVWVRGLGSFFFRKLSLLSNLSVTLFQSWINNSNGQSLINYRKTCNPFTHSMASSEFPKVFKLMGVRRIELNLLFSIPDGFMTIRMLASTRSRDSYEGSNCRVTPSCRIRSLPP